MCLCVCVCVDVCVCEFNVNIVVMHISNNCNSRDVQPSFLLPVGGDFLRGVVCKMVVCVSYIFC
jgi:hypothetical protein